MVRVAVTGGDGQLASDIAGRWPDSELGKKGVELVCLSHSDLDVTDPAQISSVLDKLQPSFVLNTAAYVRVDDCEEETAKAFQVNAIGAKNLAEACRACSATLVHFSTDYVFDGAKRTPYLESDLAEPISAYGASKLAGEHFVRYVLPAQHLIVRSSGLYGVAGASGKGGNFVETMIRLAHGDAPIRVVNDQVCCPTSTFDVAATVLELLQRGFTGTIHLTNAGQCSWFEFASEIFSLLDLHPELIPITSEQFGARARRPAFSVLANEKLAERGLPALPPWQQSLRRYLQRKGHLAS